MKTYLTAFVLLAVLVFTVLLMRQPVAQEATDDRSTASTLSTQGDAPEYDPVFRRAVESEFERLEARIAKLEQQPSEASSQKPDSRQIAGTSDFKSDLNRDLEEMRRTVDRLKAELSKVQRDVSSFPRLLDRVQQDVRAIESSVSRLQNR